ncbi:unnamed protein product [Symbiodinium natans]|uniref:Uncharacterized protein n=1 Tax=Symbiodinium natans TaxID=878477 RepID=A0A812MEZ1_9DINO|nr:unnamed protein product [Symbiodinium natans]
MAGTALRDLDRALSAATRVNEQKVSSLLNSQNRLRCENAALKRSDLERRSASQGRGAALAKSERELLEQDTVLRAFYNFLGKDGAAAA